MLPGLVAILRRFGEFTVSDWTAVLVGHVRGYEGHF
jgi:hypothetical protein